MYSALSIPYMYHKGIRRIKNAFIRLLLSSPAFCASRCWIPSLNGNTTKLQLVSYVTDARMFWSWFACSRSRCCFAVGGKWPQSVCVGSLTRIIIISLHVFSMFWNKTLITFYISLCDEPNALDSLLWLIKHLHKCRTQRETLIACCRLKVWEHSSTKSR